MKCYDGGACTCTNDTYVDKDVTSPVVVAGAGTSGVDVVSR